MRRSFLRKCLVLALHCTCFYVCKVIACHAAISDVPIIRVASAHTRTHCICKFVLVCSSSLSYVRIPCYIIPLWKKHHTKISWGWIKLFFRKKRNFYSSHCKSFIINYKVLGFSRRETLKRNKRKGFKRAYHQTKH